MPGRILPALPRKNKQSSTASNLFSGMTGRTGSDASSLSSVSTMATSRMDEPVASSASMRNLTVQGKKCHTDHSREILKKYSDDRRAASANSLGVGTASPRSSTDGRQPGVARSVANSTDGEVRLLFQCFGDH